jgi:hypothetical protein
MNEIRMASKILSAFTFTVLTISCAKKAEMRTVLVPQIGAEIPCHVEPNQMHFTSSSSWSSMCSIVVDSVEYDLYSHDYKTIERIATHDFKFQTKEGIGVGSTLKDVLAKGGTEVWCEPGWSCQSELPSGWYAVFPPMIYNPARSNQYPTESSRVVELFRER